MLSELRIENFAIIDRLELSFEKGLIILTGETGAGKSIILDAVEILIGGRADTSVVRSDASRATVEGTFRINGAGREAIHKILKEEDLLDDEDYLTLSREVRREGRSIARINGRTVNVALLKTLGGLLIDIHGQSEHLSLMDTRAHLNLLDRYANISSSLNSYRTSYKKLVAIRSELNKLRQSQADAERRIEFLSYQADEIHAAKLQLGEDNELKQERDRLANAEHLSAQAQEALATIDEGTPESSAVTDLFGKVTQNLAALAKTDASQSSLSEQATSLLENLTEIAHELRDYLENIEFSPSRLEEVEERLDLIVSLKRKYGGSIKSILAFGKDSSQELKNISHAEERTTDLESQEKTLLKKLAQQGGKLSSQRKVAAKKMSKGIETELNDLRMESALFAVDFQTLEDAENGIPVDGKNLAFDATGFDRVEFLLAPNPGEGLKPLVKVASGGETSRMMLALKNILAKADQVPSLIFDEIDQGIGGRIGMVVGEKLWQLARQHQVFCVTHLPQLAAFGEQHLQVQKVLKEGRTLTRVELLEGEPRLLELAQMLGDVGEGTLRSAYEIFQTAQSTTS